jgi:glycosyltransferase involved in cell wall biosynthesis
MQINKISFIVIARNEAFSVNKCLQSISNMELQDCEVICVDSNSMDSTLDVMKSYIGKISSLRIIQISGYINASVARNAGMKYASKDYIFFVDGDIELYPEFIHKSLKRIQAGRADAVTGKLYEIQYNSDYEFEIRRLIRRKMMTQEKRCLMTGGIFIATKEIVLKTGMFDKNFFRLQDFDYTLRLSRHGVLLQLPEFIGVHHTQEFHDRSWEYFKKGFPLLYGRLIRDNLDCPTHLIRLLRGNRGLATFLLFIITILCGAIVALLFSFSLMYVLMIGIICLLIDYVYSVIVKRIKINQWFLHNYLEPPMVLFGLFGKTKSQTKATQLLEVT